jgi:hypothetical protein
MEGSFKLYKCRIFHVSQQLVVYFVFELLVAADMITVLWDVVWYKFADVSEEYTASKFRVEIR